MKLKLKKKEAGVSAKKVSKKPEAPKSAPKKSKTSKGVPLVVGKAVAEMTTALEKAVARVDACVEKVSAAEALHAESLVLLQKALNGKTSFKHPKLGYLSVMKRGERVYWRPKPNGHG